MIAKASTNTRRADDNAAETFLAFRANAEPPFQGCGEPPLAEVIADDAVQQMMARDGVQLDQLLDLLDEVRTRLL